MQAYAVQARLGAFFAAEPGDPVAAYLFGSVARGEATAASDVDVAVLCASDPPLTYEGLPSILA